MVANLKQGGGRKGGTNNYYALMPRVRKEAKRGDICSEISHEEAARAS